MDEGDQSKQDPVTETRLFLLKLDYPASKREIVAKAKAVGDSQMLRRVRLLPEAEYQEEDLENALGELL